MGKAKHKKVTCEKCGNETKIFTDSVEKDGPTVWRCNHQADADVPELCGHDNIIEAK